ncbi:MAG: M17 family metallopeptidase, partial [Polyangiaceae bacterium]|nr:M17 family metallopeptidase [Polyangiaceae bacterium]
MAVPKLHAVDDAATAAVDARWDAVVLVSPTLTLPDLPALQMPIRSAANVDARVGHDVMLLAVPAVAGGRLILAPTGPLDRDYDDVRQFGEAARVGIVRARDAGAKRPLLLVPRVPIELGYEHALEVALLGALAGLWQPLEAREARGENGLEPVTDLGFVAQAGADPDHVSRIVSAIEHGRRLTRDLAGSDPERMRPAAFATVCRDVLAATPVQVDVLDDPEMLRTEYPLLHAVARASLSVPRHRPCVIRFVYQGAGEPRETLFLAGKGVTYDTGGADLKVGGHMAGMSRDKGGGAAVAGLFRVLSLLRPEGLRVVAEIGAVRNSIGADAY